MAQASSLPTLPPVSFQAAKATIAGKPIKFFAIVIAVAVVIVPLQILALSNRQPVADSAQDSAANTVNMDGANAFTPLDTNITASDAANIAANPAFNAAQPLAVDSKVNAIQPAAWDGIAQALLPGNLVPASASCGRAHQNMAFGDMQVRDCYARQISGYRLVQMIIDSNNNMIVSSTVYVSGLRVVDLINKWGKPLGYKTANYSSVIYWSGSRAYLTSWHIGPTDKVDFLTFDNTHDPYQSWTDYPVR